MSKDSTTVGPEHFAYIAAGTVQEDDLLRGLRTAAATAGLPTIHIAPEQAAFLQIVLRATRAVEVVEVGTLGGYSAIAMARGLPATGRLITLEIEPRHAAFARGWIARSDVARKIEVRLGDAKVSMAALADRSADAVFLDADKEGYVAYLQQALRILRPGGLLLADNVLAGGEVIDPHSRSATARAIRAFHEAVARCKELQPIIVPLGDGCLLAVRA